MIKIIDCPRDAMQGLEEFIPTALKIEYLNQLLKVGFSALDFGSFVSPKAIPQMRDTAEVLAQLDKTEQELIAIVANSRGAEDALTFKEISHLGFPLSISETFQQRNTRKSIEEAWAALQNIQNRCIGKRRQLIVYLSMAFGNPYEEAFHPEMLLPFLAKLQEMEVHTVMISDTIGNAEVKAIQNTFHLCHQAFPQMEIGMHLHSTPYNSKSKIEAALEAGVTRLDGALGDMAGARWPKKS
ncbi:hydroxymethylglutaryl-CoA lyase [Persicobacter sp. CCB-QB2]|uniref:hydroxymethylglutaryl-CoA lyase n=1 Tax=Persicobacter sp. CCB-QB2 TaxID=1561025 RepID=UPI000A4307F8